jgi:hypothetical protein
LTETEYRKLLIDSVRAGEYLEKDALLDLLKISSLRFEKTNAFTRHLWDHCQEYIHVCIVPDKMLELKKHFEYLKKLIYDIYPPNDDYELWDVEIKPGSMPDIEDVSQEIVFENIRNQIIEEIRAAKYIIWVSVAWFTDPVLYQELLKKKRQGLVIEIALDECEKNRNAEFKLEDDYPVHWITVQSYYQNIMHEKFCVIDLYTSIHGTFNWTKAANYNKEHISIDKNHATAEAFADEFMKLKNRTVWES